MAIKINIIKLDNVIFGKFWGSIKVSRSELAISQYKIYLGMMKRRKFCGLFSLGTMVSCFPVLLAACTSSEPAGSELTGNSVESTSSKTAIRTDGFVVVGTSDDLVQSGAILHKTTRGEPVTIVRDSKRNLHAVNSLCTHRGCNVGWKTDTKDLYCACHGSQFNADGKVTQGPATEDLRTYEVKEENGSILLKA